MKETGHKPEDGQILQDLLSKAIISDSDSQCFICDAEPLLSPDHAATVMNVLKISTARDAIRDILVSSLLKALFGLSYLGLEVNCNDLSYFQLLYFDTLTCNLFPVMSAFNFTCVTTY